MEEGSFDDAILGCHGVFHSASPVLKPSSDPKACCSSNFFSLNIWLMLCCYAINTDYTFKQNFTVLIAEIDSLSHSMRDKRTFRLKLMVLYIIWVLCLSFVIHAQTEILEPAVEGTLNVLRSCKKNPSLRRVVLTSSSSAVRVRPEGDFASNVPLDESSWSSVELCETLQVALINKTLSVCSC